MSDIEVWVLKCTSDVSAESSWRRRGKEHTFSGPPEASNTPHRLQHNLSCWEGVRATKEDNRGEQGDANQCSTRESVSKPQQCVEFGPVSQLMRFQSRAHRTTQDREAPGFSASAIRLWRQLRSGLVRKKRVDEVFENLAVPPFLPKPKQPTGLPVGSETIWLGSQRARKKLHPTSKSTQKNDKIPSVPPVVPTQWMLDWVDFGPQSAENHLEAPIGCY